MSYLVTRIVRSIRLPRELTSRPAAKGILLALADDCDDDGASAFTSVATLAREAEVSPRTVDAHLAMLKRCGLIAEQAPPRQHRPRTWRLNLAALARLADSQAVAGLKETDQQLLTSLTSTRAGSFPGSDTQPSATLRPSEAQSQNPDPQNSTSEAQPAATERLNDITNKRDTAPASRFSALTKEPNNTNFQPIRKLAIEIFTAHPEMQWPDFVEEVKTRCAGLQIDYGRDDRVPFNVVHRACAAAQGHLKFRARAV